MKSFKEQLKIVRENGCHICDICVAASCEAIFDFLYTDEDFERLCKIALNAYLHADDIIEDEIAHAINDWMKFYNNIDLLEEKSCWEILDAVCNGWDFGIEPLCEGWTGPEDCEECVMIECNCNPLNPCNRE